MTVRFLRKFFLPLVLLAVCDSGGMAQTIGVTRVEENDASITYSGTWYKNSSSLHSGGNAALTNAKDAQVTIAFTGTGINWIGLTDPWAGIAWVYLDGTL